MYPIFGFDLDFESAKNVECIREHRDQSGGKCVGRSTNEGNARNYRQSDSRQDILWARTREISWRT